MEGLGASWEAPAKEAYRAIGCASGREGAAAEYRDAGEDGGAGYFAAPSSSPVRVSRFPVEPGGKRPLTATATGFWEATTDEHELARWWRRWPRANVAIPTGRSSSLLVLDVSAGEGLRSIAKLERARAVAHDGEGIHGRGWGAPSTSATLPSESYGQRDSTGRRSGTARASSGTDWTCAARTGTS